MPLQRHSFHADERIPWPLLVELTLKRPEGRAPMHGNGHISQKMRCWTLYVPPLDERARADEG